MNGTDWPVIKTYDQFHLARIALPLGGIGTGTVSLGGRGNLQDWEIMNRPAKGFNPGPTFFALYTNDHNGQPTSRILEGPLEFFEYQGAFGSPAQNHGLPRFRTCTFHAAYPFGEVRLEDPAEPLRVRIQAFNPLIPGDSDRSGLPVAILRFLLTNPSPYPIHAAVCGTLPNFIGMDGSQTIKDWLDHPRPTGTRQNINTWQRTGILMQTQGIPQNSEQWGTIALATTENQHISYRSNWPTLSWGDALLEFWDDFSADGEIQNHPSQPGIDMPIASLCAKRTVPAGSIQSITFIIAWHFPNRQTWTPKTEDISDEGYPANGNFIGNYYTTRFNSAWGVIEAVRAQLPQLEADTLSFVRSIIESNLPDCVKEAALFNLTALRSQTSFRTADGYFFGFEGCGDQKGCCLGSCTHVWNYEQATAFLFADLARSMREVEFLHATHENGLMSFRVHLPLERAKENLHAAADGQMGCIIKAYRDWQLSGREEFLRSLWPQVRNALAFCWIPGGWDADQDGVMEGCQHNTMDVEYYGPNPQMQGWYLGALRAAVEMATAMGDQEFAVRCQDLFSHGSTWMDHHLFNGHYYEQQIRPIPDASDIAPGLRVGMGAENLEEPELQLGAGCLVDQLVGQFMAYVCGLGSLLEKDHLSSTYKSIMEFNFRTSFAEHFNHMRSFVLGDESGLLMATYPFGGRPDRPFPYFNEVMTGFEYTAAVLMLYDGQIENGLRCIQAIRNRYDGQKRNPFDEAECGHHYARAMASWAAILALTGFHYSGVTKTITFLPVEGHWFWSNGEAWGSCHLASQEKMWRADLKVLYGNLPLRTFRLTGFGETSFPEDRLLPAGEELHCLVV